MKIYKFFREVKKQLLISQFGFITDCKHSPTCSKQTQIYIKEQGLIKGSVKGAIRIITCFGR